MEIKNQEYVFSVQALEALQDREEDELAHEQRIALENLTRQTRVKDLETLEELREELSEIEPLEQKHIYKILDLMPRHESTVRAVFSKERARVKDQHVERILEICQSVDTEN
jgi:DNA-directed RNA polymerase subunit F